MIIFVIAGVLTLLLGPFMFAFLSRLSNKYSYPVGVADSLGDGLFLVLFNAYAFSYGLHNAIINNLLLTAIIALISVSFGVIICYWRKSISEFNDWSRPNKGVFNAGGYYHSVFLTVQSFIVLYAIIYYDSIILYLLFAGYVVSFIIHEAKIKSKGHL
ncbi:MAG: hypothetical protein ACMXYL_01520 [Candidatus Woesearchaeota archaeon]